MILSYNASEDKNHIDYHVSMNHNQSNSISNFLCGVCLQVELRVF